MATKAFQKIYTKITQITKATCSLKATGVGYDELATVNGKLAQVVKIAGDDVTLQVFEGTEGIPTNAEVVFLGKAPTIKVSDQLAGRFFNAFGDPIDGGPSIEGQEVEIGGPSVNPVRRKQPSELIATGIAGIDLNNTLVSGQKIPFFADPDQPFNQVMANVALRAETDKIILGGMGVGVSLSSLAGAVAANGACGVISSVNAGYDEQDFKSSPFKANLRALDYHIKRAKQIAAESTKKGLVAVNIMTAVSHYEESCKTAVSAGADIIISGAGLPLNLPHFTKGTDTLAAPIVSSGRAARIIMKTYKKHYDVYPDMFIIEGSMAGGHLGFGADDITQGKTQSNDEILSDVLAVIEEYGADIPVFVAGGVFDGKDMAHYVNEGAAGVQIATRFIATNECDASDTFKQAVVNAKREDIRIIKSPVGMPARAINSPLLERLDAGETFTARKCNGCLTACKKDDSIPYCISRALIAAVKGDWDNGLFFAGSNADRVDRIMSVQELINEIIR